MKKGVVGAVSLAVIIVVLIVSIIICSEWVPDGYTGVVVSMSHGADDNTLGRGWHIVSPTKKVRLFTTGNEVLILTKDKREGSKDDDSFRVSTQQLCGRTDLTLWLSLLKVRSTTRRRRFCMQL